MHQKHPPANVAVAVSREKTGTVAFVPSSEDGFPEQEKTNAQRTSAVVANFIDMPPFFTVPGRVHKANPVIGQRKSCKLSL